MSEPVDEAVRKLTERLATETYGDVAHVKHVAEFERVLTEQLAPLLRAGQAMHMNAWSDHPKFAAAHKEWAVFWAKLTGRTP